MVCEASSVAECMVNQNFETRSSAIESSQSIDVSDAHERLTLNPTQWAAGHDGLFEDLAFPPSMASIDITKAKSTTSQAAFCLCPITRNAGTPGKILVHG